MKNNYLSQHGGLVANVRFAVFENFVFNIN